MPPACASPRRRGLFVSRPGARRGRAVQSPGAARGRERAGPADSLVAHHQHFQLFDIVDQELSEAGGQHVLCLLIAAVANVGHQDLPLEPPAHSVIDTSRFPPVALKKCRKYLLVTKGGQSENACCKVTALPKPHLQEGRRCQTATARPTASTRTLHAFVHHQP